MDTLVPLKNSLQVHNGFLSVGYTVFKTLFLSVKSYNFFSSEVIWKIDMIMAKDVFLITYVNHSLLNPRCLCFVIPPKFVAWDTFLK